MLDALARAAEFARQKEFTLALETG